MNTIPKTHLIEIPVGGDAGLIWNRLHSEREDICEEMQTDSQSLRGVETNISTRNWHRELLQSRLRTIDAALDRLMSGSYGHCSNCGQWIGDCELELDPAKSICTGCSEHQTHNLVGNSSSDSVQDTHSSPNSTLSELELAFY